MVILLQYPGCELHFVFIVTIVALFFVCSNLRQCFYGHAIALFDVTIRCHC